MVAQTDRRTVWQIDPKHTLVEFAVSYLTFTTVKGHFGGVSGTIRSIKRVASGVGEGAMAVSFVHQFLASR
jgi:polyisoprenoid-binding protein YceI